MWLGVLIISFVVMGIVKMHSESRLNKIRDSFNLKNTHQQQEALRNYKKHLFRFKFSRFMTEKLPYIAMAIIVIIVSGAFGVFIVLCALWWKSSLKKTNYRGYNTYNNDNYIRELDDWVIVANQTVLK